MYMFFRIIFIFINCTEFILNQEQGFYFISCLKDEPEPPSNTTSPLVSHDNTISTFWLGNIYNITFPHIFTKYHNVLTYFQEVA